MTDRIETALRGKTQLTPIQRFVRFIPPVKDRVGECWEWTGGTRGKGYGNFYDGKRGINAHRWLFQQFHPVELRSNQLVCHKCNNKLCVNPDHLYVGDTSTNGLDCVAAGNHQWAKRAHCKHGHLLTADNSVLRATGGRRCLTCSRLYSAGRRRYLKKENTDDR